MLRFNEIGALLELDQVLAVHPLLRRGTQVALRWPWQC
jgi:hypothetical protein